MYISTLSKPALYLLIVAILCIPYCATGQLPQCDRIYLDHKNSSIWAPDTLIYTFDPTQPAGPGNPVLNTISTPALNHGGLTIAPAPGTTIPTFYTVADGEVWYYNPTTLTWTNTGHFIGNLGALNLAAGGPYLYGLDGNWGKVYRYDGTGPGSLVLSVPDAQAEGPYDLIADCEGNFYVLNATGYYNPGFLRKYDPNGTLLQSWTINNPNNYRAAGGFSIIGNHIYLDHIYRNTNGNIDSVAIISCEMTATSLNMISVSAALPVYAYDCYIGDIASCEQPLIRIADIIISATDTTICGAQPVTYRTEHISNRGTAPVYEWLVNGVAIPGTNDTFYTYTPQNGDIITCRLVSNALCLTDNTVMSNAITMIVDNAVQPVLHYEPYEFCTDLTQTIYPSINTSGGIFTSAAGLSLNNNTGAISPALSTPGTYIVTYTNPPPSVCPRYKDTETVIINIAAKATIVVEPFNVPLCINDTVILRGQGGTDNDSYFWEPTERISGPKNEAVAIVKRNQEGYLHLTVTAPGGCTAGDSVYVEMGASCCRVLLPNAFSPNNDGLNDVWAPIVSEIESISNLSIFNRFGQLLFETRQPGIFWNGTHNGQPCDLGVYYYQIRYICDDGSSREKKGEITLVR